MASRKRAISLSKRFLAPTPTSSVSPSNACTPNWANGRGCEESGKGFLDESSGIQPRKKHQHPSSRHQRSTKLQALNGARLGAWFLGFLWSLDVGAWRFSSPPLFLQSFLGN